MKKLVILILASFFTFGVSYAQKKKVAVVTFYVDKYIGANKIEAESRAKTYEMTKQDDPRFDLTPTLEEFHKTFIKKYVKEFPFDLVPEKDVISDPKYQAYKGLEGIEDQDSLDKISEAIDDRFIAIEGYNVLLTGGNMLRSWRTEAHMMEVLKDHNIDGVMFVSMSYAWEPKVSVGGIGKAGIRTFIKIELFNNEAKKVFTLDEQATSKKGVMLVGGAPILDYKKLLPMCEDATERLLEDLEKKLPKLVKKVDKSL